MFQCDAFQLDAFQNDCAPARWRRQTIVVRIDPPWEWEREPDRQPPSTPVRILPPLSTEVPPLSTSPRRRAARSFPAPQPVAAHNMAQALLEDEELLLGLL